MSIADHRGPGLLGLARAHRAALGAPAPDERGGNEWAIVLAAGDGTRLQELTGGVPKQYYRLRGRSLLARALERAERIAPPERTLVIVAASHRRWWRSELAALPRENLVVQPENRGTAAGVLLPLLTVLERDAHARVAILPSDHHVHAEWRVADALRAALAESAGSDDVVLLGMEPEWAEPSYGWIVPRAPAVAGPASAAVAAFVEKPGLEGARECLVRGGLWNSFLLAARASALLELLRCVLPDLVGGLELARVHSGALARLYARLPASDFSREVLERSVDRLRVRPVPACGWSDLGTPERVARCLGELDAYAPARSVSPSGAERGEGKGAERWK